MIQARSVLPWLAGNPDAWRPLPLREAGLFVSGGTPATDELAYWDGSIPWVSSQDVRGSEVEHTSRSITEAGLTNSSARVVPGGAVVFVMRSGILRHTIPAAVLKVACAINQDIKALVPRPQSPWSMRFLTYFVQGWQQELLTYWHDQGATVESLRFDIMLRTLVPLPPSGSADAV